MAVDTPPFPAYTNYQRLPAMVLGFHGCDRSVGEDVLSGVKKHLKESKNAHDWLGSGIYFWENDPRRAMEWAHECMRRPSRTGGSIREPFVIGAVIELGFCFNLMARECVVELERAYQTLKLVKTTANAPMPQNKGPAGVQRFLDRAVVETVHGWRRVLSKRKKADLPSYDTVRAAFKEGEPVYPGAGFEKKNHIQIAVRDPARIKGYFRPFEG